MPKLTINGLRYHYWQSGPKNAPHVLMIHGLGGNLAVWYAGIAQNLWDMFRVTTIDLISHGHSAAVEDIYPLDAIVRDMETFLGRFDLQKTHIIGHCLGGDIALNLAYLRPEIIDRIIVIEVVLADLADLYSGADWEGWAYFAGELEKHTGIPVPEEKRNDVDYLFQRVQETPLAHGPARGRMRKTKQIERLRQGLEMIRRAGEERADQEEKELEDYIAAIRLDDLPNIRQPCLLIYESDSFFMSSHDALKERLPNSHSVFVPPAQIRHLSVLDHSKYMSAYIRAFLSTGSIDIVTEDDVARAQAMVV